MADVDPTAAAAAAPAQPAAVTAPVESDFAAFEREETAADLARAAGTAPPPKPAAVAAPAGEDAPAVDAKGQPVNGPDGKQLSRRQQAANEKMREAIDRGIATEKARADAAERRATEAEAKLRPAEPAKPAETAAAAEDREPVLDDFMDQPDPYLALQKAAVKWEIAQIRKTEAAEREQAQRAQRANDGVRQVFEGYQAREAEFIKTTPDFLTKTEAVRHQLNMSSPLSVALIESEVSPALILHFADHPEDFERIGRLGSTNLPAALRELGKLEAKYEPSAAQPAPAAPAASHVTKAPPPGTFLGSQPAPAADASRAAVARGDFSAFDAEEIAKDLARVGRR